MTVKIKNILVPLDGSKTSMQGLEQAIYLAEKIQANITGLSVISFAPTALASMVTDYRSYLTKKAEKNMKDAKKLAEAKGISFKSKIIYGSPGSKIVDYAKKEKFDLIVIGARGMNSVKEAFLGSVSHYITHKVRIPVLLVK